MKAFKIYLIMFIFVVLCLTLSSPVALASNIIVDDDAEPSVSGLYLTSNYANDAACIQAALDNSKSGDTIIIREGDYYITKRIYQKDKSLTITGEGEVTLHLQTAAGSQNGLYFQGSKIATQSLSADAQKGAFQVVLSDASQVQKGDLIKIWKKVQWCPSDYPDQMTGEMYQIESVSGNTVTLNEPLLRDYELSETVQVEVCRPIEMHIQNIRVQDSDATTAHEGLALRYCKDSSVTDSWFKDNGFAAVSFYSSFNVDVSNNEIYNCIMPGSGYGVGIWSGTAYANIENNHIENCRHAITGNTDERKTLNRDIEISDNTIIGANIETSHAIDAHPVTISYKVTGNRIYLEPGFYAFNDGAQQSVFSENKVYGGYGAVLRRGSVSDGVHVIEDNYIEGTFLSFTYRAWGSGKGDTLMIVNNNQNGGRYGVFFSSEQPESFRNIVISGNTFSNLSNKGVYLQFLIDGINLKIFDNTFENIKEEGIYIDGNSHKSNNVEIQNNNLINVFSSSSGSGVITKNIQQASVGGNQMLEEGALVRAVDRTIVAETQETEVLTADEQSAANDITPAEIVTTNEVDADKVLFTEEEISIITDNRLRESSPDQVYQEKGYIDIGERPRIGRYRDLLFFDLSDYNDAENINSATLSLYWYYPDGQERPEDSVVEIYRPAAPWNPESVTWNSRDKDVLWTQPGGDWFDINGASQGDIPYATITLKGSDIPDNRYYELDVTDLVKEYASGEYENTGFLIKTRGENADYVAFYSSEVEDENQCPMLTIEEKS